MKFYMRLPGAGEIYFESKPREPISYERFIAVCVLIGVLGSMAQHGNVRIPADALRGGRKCIS